MSANVNVPGGTTVDLGGRDLVVAAGVTINVQSAGRCSGDRTKACSASTDCLPAPQSCLPSQFTIIANNVTLQTGAKILSGAFNGTAQDLSITAAGAFTMQSTSQISVSAGNASSLLVQAASVAMNGSVNAAATTRDGDGGDVSIITTGDMTVAGGGINANAGDRFGCGIGIELVADGSITVGGALLARGGDCDGGDIDIDTTTGNVLVQAAASIDTSATYESGSGGSLFIDAGGDVSLGGPYLSRGKGTLIEGGGDGGDLDVLGVDVTIGGQIELVGAGPDGSGGFVDLTADGNMVLNAPMLVSGAAEGAGGDVFAETGGTLAVNSTMDLTAGFVGGSIDVLSAGDVTFAAAAVMNAGATPGVQFGQYGGIIDVRGCSITVPNGAQLSVAGLGPFPHSVLRLYSSNQMTVGGTLTAAVEVGLRYRMLPPVVQATAVITPAPVVTQDPNLPCCVGCPTTTTTSTTTSTSTSLPTTTSTSLPTTTTTSLPTTTSSSVTTTTSTTTSTSVPTSSTVTTTSTLSSTTTSTTLPPTCLDEPLAGYAAVDCAIGVLEDDLNAQSDEALGGRKSARRLVKKVLKAQDLVEKSKTSKRQLKLLDKAARKVGSFDKQLGKLVDKQKIDPLLVADLTALSGEVTARIEGVMTPVTP